MLLKKYNKNLAFTKPDWYGNPLNKKGLYTNLFGDDIKSAVDVFRWISGPKPFSFLKKNQASSLQWQQIADIKDKSENAIIPVGHACFIIDLNGVRLLIDPVTAPNRFLKRYTKVPFQADDLNNVDYLLLSHNHRDHIDKKSVLQICKINPKVIILTGLEIGRQLKRWGGKK